MKKHLIAIPVLAVCAAAMLAMPALSRAQDASTNAPAVQPPAPMPPPATPAGAPAAGQTAPAKPSKPHALPFHGDLASVDTNAMTFVVGKRTFQVTSRTRIFKDDQPATLSDGVAGQSVRGSYRKNDKGGLDAVTVHFGGKPAAADTSKPPAGN